MEIDTLNTVPISQFNKGMAGKIFAEVKTSGLKIVLKNNQPECVLISPVEYTQILEDRKKMKALAAIRLVEDLRVAEEECEKYGSVSEEELCKEFKVTL